METTFGQDEVYVLQKFQKARV